jgi:magnesium transporter
VTVPSPAATQAVLDQFAELYPEEVALLLDRAPLEEVVDTLASLSTAPRNAVFRRLTPEVAAYVLNRIEKGAARDFLRHIDPHTAAGLLARLDETARELLLVGLTKPHANELRKLLSYPAGTAGRLMDPRATTFRPETSVGDAQQRLRQVAPKQFFHLFLVDEGDSLVGVVPLQALALAESHIPLAELAQRTFVSVTHTAPREEVVDLLERHKLAGLPVVDIDNRLLGVIRLDALVAAAERQVTADMQSMVGVSKEERALSRVSFAVQKRLPWLQINLGTAFLAASVVALFEDTIARVTALAVLLPVVAGQSGNTGAQALAVIVRGLALREISVRNWKAILRKEFGAGLINGLAVALVTCLGVFVWSGSVGLTLVIGVAMVLSMAIAGVAGASIPLILSALGQDPAQSSSIVLTTVTDVFGFFSFLGLATLFLAML